MGYLNLAECVADLERHGMLRRVEIPVDPYLEMAEIQRRVYRAGGPALLFTRPKNSRFPMVSNLYGTLERVRFLFRDALPRLEKLMRLQGDPGLAAKAPWKFWNLPRSLWHALPKFVRRGPILSGECSLRDLPSLVCWPRDGGPFITLPAVYSESPDSPGWTRSNLGMYRVQLSGNDYDPEREVGLHYQIHRGIGIHHGQAIAKGQKLRVAIWVGGPPALALSAVMPLPEKIPELAFAGVLGGRRQRFIRLRPEAGFPAGVVLPAEADFCLVGTVDPSQTKPEGPFGDHLGYYSLTHPFPVVQIEKVYHRPGAIWPFTVVGRPPQEDTSFGEFIHELTAPVLPAVLPGIREVHAVDAAGVHPLLLAIGSERYVPYSGNRKPQELLTQACAILGQGQLSLAKFLLMVATEDDPSLIASDIPKFFQHLLRRLDPRRDLHFLTRTTIDTLDYSGDGFNNGSKVIIAAAGETRRELPTDLGDFPDLPSGWRKPRVCLPGVLALQGPAWERAGSNTPGDASVFAAAIPLSHPINKFPLVFLVDDSDFVSASLENWLWAAFTRANPATDLHGVCAATVDKHWGCAGAILLDARIKPHHAPPLIEDPAVSRRVDELAARGGPLAGLF